MNKESLSHRIEVAWLESERYLDHVRYFEQKSDESETRVNAFVRCRRLERCSQMMESIARKMNTRVNMNFIRRISRDGDQLCLDDVEKSCKEVRVSYRWYIMYKKLTEYAESDTKAGVSVYQTKDADSDTNVGTYHLLIKNRYI